MNYNNYMKNNKHLYKRVALAFLAFLLLSVAFIALADYVFDGTTLAFDQAVLQSINAGSTNFWNTFMLTLTHLGGVAGVVILTGLLVGALAYKRKYRPALFVALGVGGAALVNVILKLIFERARPDLWEQLVIETSFSFPSGHAMASAALAFCVVILFWHTKYRLIASILAGLYMVIIGFSRLYLGVHYPTDVLAGWIVSGAWVVLVTTLFFGLPRRVKNQLRE
jgi:undecaprenyl-diphosphatase